MDIQYLLDIAVKQQASDLHIATGNPPIIRVDGVIKKSNAPPLGDDAMAEMLKAVMTDAQWDAYLEDKDLTFTIAGANGHRFRIAAFFNAEGPAAVVRAIRAEPMGLDEIGVPPQVRRLAEMESGLIIVTGAMGMGRTTTVAAMTDYINRNFARHVITIERPIEYRHPSRRSLVNQREVGVSAWTFARALEAAMFEDPNVLVLGEVPDFETLDHGLRAAETGRLVLMVMSTGSAAQAIDHIVTDYPQEHQTRVRAMLSASLQGVIAQTLLTRSGGKGRVAAFEVLLGTPAVRNLIRDGNIQQLYSMMQMGARYGMQTMPEAIEDLVRTGQIDQEEAIGLLAPSGGDDGGAMGLPDYSGAVDDEEDGAAGSYPY